ncbi:hypothetical protein H4696_004975 [Amycolatopsis lexingtonensis]|uniref:DUF6603 domain-containing protein n=1 Tax=Amycolatopsis lexingtonensis TaxID=218822 RepID=A0ABR9I3W5_9PSEU|nr:DUF6603 domain-containing protein [Amycolatopsis lexingtonensis]MBE1497875.1 hypothetical protein [Amycolatopsis lexingtonensis]
MTTPDDTFQQILLREVRLLLVPFAGTIEGGTTAKLLSDTTGWDLLSGTDPANDVRVLELSNAYQALDALVEDTPHALADVVEALRRLTELWATARELPVQPLPGGEAAGVLGRDLAEGLVLDDLRTWHPLVHDILALLTIIRLPGGISLDRVVDLFTHPLTVLGDEYLGPGGLTTADDARVAAGRLFPRLASLLRHLGLHAEFGTTSLGGPLPADAAARVAGGMLSVYLQPDFEDPDRYGVTLALSPRDLGGPGLVVVPFGQVSPFWDADIDLRPAADGFAIGPAGVTLFGTSGPLHTALTIAELPGQVIGAVDATRLELGTVTVSATLALDPKNPEYGLTVDLGESSLVIEASDGFLASILPADGLRTTFDLGVAWSNTKGLHFTGSAGLDVSLPGFSVGGVLSVPSVDLSLHAVDDHLAAQASAALSVFLGPVHATVVGAGFGTKLTFPAEGGNLGVADIELAGKPPTGVGLTIGANGVSGGGFLSFDAERGEYAGAVELELADFLAVKGIGLITTRRPDGSPGFSLLVVLTAEFPAGIQLGAGFTLLAVGGLIGLNRGMNLQALVEGVANGAIESVAFPKDVVANAPRILSDLNRFFPVEEGTFLVGPMVKIGWGTPTLISVSLGVIVEIPGDIAVLGVVRAALPTADHPLLLLQAQFIGALELSKSRAWFFAKLFRSRIMGMTVEGGMGVLTAWGSASDLIITVGGFHPSFRPPPLPFPVPDRLAVPLLNRSGQLVRLTGYFAITPNTVQFGGDVEVRLGFSAFRVEGHLGVDGLIQRSPFRFTAHTGGDVSLKVFGIGVFTLGLDFTLEGPAPWRAHGRGSIGFLFFSVSADFDLTWGEALDVFLPPIAVLDLLASELNKPEGWETRLPSGGKQSLVSLRVLPGTDDLVLHPLGTLVITQRALPLNVRVDRVGGQRASDGKRFSVEPVAGTGLKRAAITGDRFAMAQYQDMSDAAKLSRPSYETQDAGLELTAADGALATARVVRRSARYELHVIGDDAPVTGFAAAPPVKRFHSVAAPVFEELRKGASTSRAPLSARQARQKQPFAAQDTVRIDEQRFVVAYVKSNRQAFPRSKPGRPRVAATFRSRATAEDALAGFVADDPALAGRLHVIPAAEAAITPGVPGTWSPAGTLPTPVSTVDMAALPSGAVLIAGGTDDSGAPVAATALFDPAGDSWAAGPALAKPRQQHTTTALLDGRVLVAGGAETASAELFDPAGRRWTPTSSMTAVRHGHSATRLADGRVLVAGGRGALTTAEVYDPKTGTWTATAPMTDARADHQAVLLNDGRVLVVGGALPTGDGGAAPLAYCELYDPATQEWTPTGTLHQPRAGHQAVLLPDHRVLVTGGDPVLAPDRTLDPHSLATVELYDPKTGGWQAGPSMPGGGRSRHRALTLRSGTVLVTGGTGAPERTAGYRSVLTFDPVADAWSPLGGLLTGRSAHAMTELPDDRVLLAAGAGPGEVLIP